MFADSTASTTNDLLIRFQRCGHPFTINVPNFLLIFMSILLEAMPFIVLGAVVAGLLEELLPQKLITRLLPRSRFLSIAIGGLLGLLFPDVRVRHHPRDAPPAAEGAAGQLLHRLPAGGPIINVVVMLSTFLAFDGKEKTPVLGWHGAADGRPVDDGPTHGPRLSRGHRY